MIKDHDAVHIDHLSICAFSSARFYICLAPVLLNWKVLLTWIVFSQLVLLSYVLLFMDVAFDAYRVCGLETRHVVEHGVALLVRRLHKTALQVDAIGEDFIWPVLIFILRMITLQGLDDVEVFMDLVVLRAVVKIRSRSCHPTIFIIWK